MTAWMLHLVLKRTLKAKANNAVSFQSDMASDMENVFFNDFKHEAIINGKVVKGYLFKNAHEFGSLDTNQIRFDIPSTQLPALERRSIITVEGVKYVYITKESSGDLVSLILERSRS